MSSLLVGAWELCEENSDGVRYLFVFTDKHYANVFEFKNRITGFRGEQPTEAEEAEAYRTFRAGGGTYQISGSTLTLNAEYDRRPDGHRPLDLEFAVEGDKLMLKSPRSEWGRTLTKVS